MSPPAERPIFPPFMVLIVGIFATSISAILIRFAQTEAPSLVIAAGRTTLATLFLLPLALTRRRTELRTLPPAGYLLAALSGLMLALHFASWITSLEYTSVASASVLFATAPFWVALVSPLFLSESIPRPVQAGIALAFIGSTIIALATGGGGTGRQTLLGNGLALVGAITYAAYFLLGRRLRSSLSLVGYTTLVYGAAAVCLLTFALLSGQSFAGYSPQTYLLILLMALFPQLLGHSSFNYALGYLPAAFVSLASISEPVGATLLAFLILQEVPGPATLLGGLFILAGVWVGSRK